jgi:hypothetical protein
VDVGTVGEKSRKRNVGVAEGVTDGVLVTVGVGVRVGISAKV